jgi:hypothetical protein
MWQFAVGVTLHNSRGEVIRNRLELVVRLRFVDKLQCCFNKLLRPTIPGLGLFVGQLNSPRSLLGNRPFFEVIGSYNRDPIPLGREFGAGLLVDVNGTSGLEIR